MNYVGADVVQERLVVGDDEEGLLPVLHVVSVARWQNLTPSFPWIEPGWRAWGRNPRGGRDQIL